jgi:hypothetical protein
MRRFEMFFKRARYRQARLAIPITSVRKGSVTLTPACQSNADSTLFSRFSGSILNQDKVYPNLSLRLSV